MAVLNLMDHLEEFAYFGQLLPNFFQYRIKKEGRCDLEETFLLDIIIIG